MSIIDGFERFLLSLKVSKKSANLTTAVCVMVDGALKSLWCGRLPRCVLNTWMCMFYLIHDIYRAGCLITWQRLLVKGFATANSILSHGLVVKWWRVIFAFIVFLYSYYLNHSLCDDDAVLNRHWKELEAKDCGFMLHWLWELILYQMPLDVGLIALLLNGSYLKPV